MKNSLINENDPEVSAVSSTVPKPNLKGDWLNFFLLLLFYTMQGLPIGVSTAFPILLQGRKEVTYKEQALFSLVLWPYSIKLLWAPLVDALYVQWMGRRKSWLIPVQYLMGLVLIYASNNIDDWLPETGKPNIEILLMVFFVVNYLAATHDIAVDSWALTMLKKQNVSYASTCNGTGLSLGIFIGFVCPILLTSEDFCNKYFRMTPGTGGVVTFSSLLFGAGIIFMTVSTLVSLFKSEKAITAEDGFIKITVTENYRLLWNILKLPCIRVLILAILTARIGFSTMESVSNLKLIDAGVSKHDIIITSMFISVVKIILPLTMIKHTSGPRPMNLYLKMTPVRTLWSVTYAVLIYYTPSLIKNLKPVYYNCILGFIWSVNEALYCTMSVSVYSFFSRISDPRFGATYMTLLNTVNTLGWVAPNTMVLKLVDTFTIYKCSNNVQNSCSTPELKNMCKSDGGDCAISVDGFYVETVLCMVIGFAWYFIFKNIIESLQNKNSSQWLVNVKEPSLENEKTLSSVTSG